QRKEFFKDEESRKAFSLEDFLKRLKVSQSKDTQIVEVNYQSKSPQEVKFVLDQLASIYLKYTINDQNFQSEQKLYFLDKQIPIIKQRILFLQKRLEAFRLKNDFIDPTNQGLVISEGWKALNNGKQENDAQLRDAIALYQGLKQQLGIGQSEAIALNALNESPRYMALLAKLREIDTKLAGESTRFTEESPTVRQLQEERQNLLPLIQQEAKVALNGLSVKPGELLADFVSPNTTRQSLTQQLLVAANQVQQLQARERSLNLSEQKIKIQVQNYARSAAGYAELAGQLEIESQGLASLLTARQALQIDAAKSFSPWRLVSDIRTPEKPQSQLLRNLLLASLAGFVAGGATGLLLESLDRNFHSSEDLAEHTGLTVLGTIPVLEKIDRVKKITNQKKLEQLFSKTPTGWMAFLESFSFL
ncbi:MAG: GumC family protein, partial [Microcystaceae cyanobacterium]